MKGYQTLRKQELASLISEQGNLCAYCAEVMTVPHIDHFEPRSTHANDSHANLVLVCRRCNAQKNNKPFIVFLLTRKRTNVDAYWKKMHYSRIDGEDC